MTIRGFNNDEDLGTSGLEDLAIALSQCLILDGRTREYLDCVTSHVLPLFVKLWKPEYDSVRRDSFDGPRSELLLAITATLLPLYERDFQSRIARKTLRQALSRWQVQRQRSQSKVARLLMDRLLRSACLRLGERERADADSRGIERTVDGRNSTSIGGVPTNVNDLRALQELFLTMRLFQDRMESMTR